MQGFNSTKITLSMILHPPMWAFRNFHSSGIPRSTLPLAIRGNMEDTPPITFPLLLPLYTHRRLSFLPSFWCHLSTSCWKVALVGMGNILRSRVGCSPRSTAGPYVSGLLFSFQIMNRNLVLSL